MFQYRVTQKFDRKFYFTEYKDLLSKIDIFIEIEKFNDIAFDLNCMVRFGGEVCTYDVLEKIEFYEDFNFEDYEDNSIPIIEDFLWLRLDEREGYLGFVDRFGEYKGGVYFSNDLVFNSDNVYNNIPGLFKKLYRKYKEIIDENILPHMIIGGKK